jgi:hypothetical protein
MLSESASVPMVLLAVGAITTVVVSFPRLYG